MLINIEIDQLLSGADPEGMSMVLILPHPSPAFISLLFSSLPHIHSSPLRPSRPLYIAVGEFQHIS